VVATVLLTAFILSATRSTFLWYGLILLHSFGAISMKKGPAVIGKGKIHAREQKKT
jgi:hypothetical protein